MNVTVLPGATHANVTELRLGLSNGTHLKIVEQDGGVMVVVLGLGQQVTITPYAGHAVLLQEVRQAIETVPVVTKDRPYVCQECDTIYNQRTEGWYVLQNSDAMKAKVVCRTCKGTLVARGYKVVAQDPVKERIPGPPDPPRSGVEEYG